MTGELALWLGFSFFILIVLVLDLGVFHKRDRAIGTTEALALSFLWIVLAGIFNVVVYAYYGPVRALEFSTGYVLERALGIDNLFVFVVIFSYFKVPKALLHRVLFWGIFGALAMRAAMIFGGIALLTTFHWLLYILGAFLVLTGIRIAFQRESYSSNTSKNLAKQIGRFMPVTDEYHGNHFFVRPKGKWAATPLFLVLLAVEFSDLIFAVDSISAIFAVTSDPFIIYTSNVFAIFGFRALYFALEGMMDLFHYLKYGLSLILIFVGGKILLAPVIHVPIWMSLLVIAMLVAGSVVASLLWPKKNQDA